MSKLIFELNGHKVFDNSTYIIVGKPDSSAPKGLDAEGHTKIPNDFISNTIPCKFDSDKSNRNKGKYDTGFYPSSRCYKGQDNKKTASLVKTLNTHVVKPYEKIHAPGILHHGNLDFWDEFSVEISLDKRFDTSDVEDLLSLYILVLNKDVAPMEHYQDSKYRGAQYRLVSEIQEKTTKQEKENSYLDALFAYRDGMKNNTLNMRATLAFIDVIPYEDKITEQEINPVFKAWLDESYDNVNTFKRHLEEIGKKGYEDTHTLYIKLREKYGSKKITYDAGYYYFDGESIGTTLRDSARILNSPGNEELKLKIFS